MWTDGVWKHLTRRATMTRQGIAMYHLWALKGNDAAIQSGIFSLKVVNGFFRLFTTVQGCVFHSLSKIKSDTNLFC